MRSRVRITEAEEPFALVQVIFTTWSKEYRGGPGATQRNRVPEAIKLPASVLRPAEPAYLVHASRRGFGSVPAIGRLPGGTVQVRARHEPLKLGGVWIEWNEDRLVVDYHWTSEAGMPERHTRRGVLTLAPGQWGRVRYNARISAYHTLAGWDYDDWWYEKWVFNIGLFSALAPRVFVDTEPIQVHSQIDLLW